MGTPTVTALGTPSGKMLRDGYSTRIAFSLNATIELWIKTVKPPSMEGGDPVDQTTMHNATFKTKIPQSLIDVGESTFKCAYDPNAYSSIQSLINAKTGCVTFQFADGSTVSVFGYLKTFDPAEIAQGQQPEATCTIVTTNIDPSDWSEAAPHIVSVSGT